MKRFILSCILCFMVSVIAISLNCETASAAMNPNVLVGKWRVEFDDGKTGWLTLQPRDNHGHLPGRLYIPKSTVDYPPGKKRRGINYNNNIFISTPTSIDLGQEFQLWHQSTPSSGQGMFHCSLVADGVLVGRTLLCEDGGKIMKYPGTGYPFQFMGSGNFTATKY